MSGLSVFCAIFFLLDAGCVGRFAWIEIHITSVMLVFGTEFWKSFLWQGVGKNRASIGKQLQKVMFFYRTKILNAFVMIGFPKNRANALDSNPPNLGIRNHWGNSGLPIP